MRYLLGPELFWLILYVAARLLYYLNHPPVKAIESFIDQAWFLIPALSILVFGLWWIPQVEKDWLLLRVWIAGIIGGHFVIEKTISALSTQGPGAGMGYLAAILFVIIILGFGTVVVLLFK